VFVGACDVGAPQGIAPTSSETSARDANRADAGRSDRRDADAGAVDTAGGGFRAAWCGLHVADPGERVTVLATAAEGYEAARAGDCRTRGLLPELDALDRRNWLDYLIGYDLLMLGCRPRATPVLGGILAYGPANTPVIGIARPPLGRDDVELLSAQYLEALYAVVTLEPAERIQVEGQLRTAGEDVIDGGVSAGLSTCSRDGGV
jgi:hypothetical protein